MTVDTKLLQAIGQRMQGYKATTHRATQIAAEVAQMEKFMKRQAQLLTFEDEPAIFIATRRRSVKT